MRYETGQRGTTKEGAPVYVAKASKVKGVIGEVYRYWVVPDADGKPGDGRMKLLDIGELQAVDGPPRAEVTPEGFDQTVMPGCAHLIGTGKRRRR